MPSRRTVLAAAAVITAGCSGQGSESTTSAGESDEPAGDSSSAPPVDVTAVANWHFETGHEGLGLVALGGGPETPVVYAGRGVDPNAEDPADQPAGDTTAENYPLYALGLESGRKQWRTPLSNPVQARPVYAGDADAGTARLYVVTGSQEPQSNRFALHALDPTSGEPYWSVSAEDGSLHLLATTEDTVFVGQRADRPDQSAQAISALDAADGAERWRIESGPLVRDTSAHTLRRETLFVTTQTRLRALEPATGDERWHVDATDDGDLAGPAFGSRSKRVAVGSGTVLRALSLTGGEELWRRDLEFEITDITTPSAATSSTIFVDAPDGRLLAVNPVDGGNVWSHTGTGDRGTLTVARTSDSLYVGSGGVYAINPVSGQQRWFFTPDVQGALGVHASTAVFASAVDAGRLWALDPGSGERHWGIAPGAGFAGPATAGEVAVLGVDGTVYALDGSAAP